ncbi:MAG: septum formation protein Maf [Phycisphaerae bacterium]|nr:septum formation protein Maf [Phycisphaerae bacterium]
MGAGRSSDGIVNDGENIPEGMIPRIWLASRSPRRRELLDGAGIKFDVVAVGVDDGELSPGSGGAAEWVMSLAYLKATVAWRDREKHGVTEGLVLGADTVCVLDGAIIGQPASAEEADSIIRRFAARAHDVLTGVCLIDVATGARDLFAVAATVTLGEVSDDEIRSYVESEHWRGKAGAYNYDERARAGWPLSCDGDPTAVTGLPMVELKRRLGVA